MNKFEYKNLTPFKWYVLQNFPFIEADFDAITEYQLYCKVIEYLNKTLDNVNVIGNQMEDVTNAMIELQNYVNNYFENLDVQDEINNKLNEMVEQGILQKIIADYLNSIAIFGFDNVASMKSSTNLINGSYAKTTGYYENNDGGGALYKIVDDNTLIEDGGLIHDLNNGLKAKLIVKDNIVNVKQFGAKGDGLTDDGLPIKNAFASEYNVRINKGTYIINEPLLISTNKEIFGDGQEISILKAKQGLIRGFDMFKALNLTYLQLHDFGISGNIQENPIGDVYNGTDGIHICDIVNCSNVEIYSMKIFDNAYVGIRLGHYGQNSEPPLLKNYKIHDNTILNVDCGFESLGDNIRLRDILINNNLIDGHSNSEPITFYHTGYVEDVIISNNILKNKNNANGIIVRPSAKNITISENILEDLSTGIAILNDCDNLIVIGNLAKGIDSNFYTFFTSSASHLLSNFEIANNIVENFINDCIELKNCSYGKIENNIVKGINANGSTSNKNGIIIYNSNNIICSNNVGYKHSKAPANSTTLYQLSGTCSYILINEEQNISQIDNGLYIANLTSELLNSKITTNLTILGNFNSANVGSDTNYILQKDFTYIITTPQVPYNYKFTRKINLNLLSNNSLSKLTIYNKLNYEIYEIIVNPSNNSKLTLANNSTEDFGIIWKNERDISTLTKLSLLYYNNHLYEI